MFNSIRNCQIVFQSKTNKVWALQLLHVLISICYCRHFLSSPNRYAVISHCVLNCICLVSNDGKHLLICLFVVCISFFLAKCLVSLLNFKKGLFHERKYCWVLKVFSHILDTNSLSEIWFENIFSQSETYLFILLTESSQNQSY